MKYLFVTMILTYFSIAHTSEVYGVKNRTIVFADSTNEEYSQGDVVNLYDGSDVVGRAVVRKNRDGYILADIREGDAREGDQVYGLFRDPANSYNTVAWEQDEYLWSQQNTTTIAVGLINDEINGDEYLDTRTDNGEGYQLSINYDWYFGSWFSTTSSLGGRFIKYTEQVDATSVNQYSNDQSMESKDVFVQQVLNADITFSQNFILRPFFGLIGSFGLLEINNGSGQLQNRYFRYGSVYGASVILMQNFVPFVQLESGSAKFKFQETNMQYQNENEVTIGRQNVDSITLGLGYRF